MKTNQWQGKTSRAVFAFTLLFVAAVVLSATAYAQDRYPNNDSNRRDRNLDQYGNYGGSQELRQTALNSGYDQGLRQGNYDRQNAGKRPTTETLRFIGKPPRITTHVLATANSTVDIFAKHSRRATTLTLIIKAIR